MRIMRRKFERLLLQCLCAHQVTQKALVPALSVQAVSGAVMILLGPEGPYRLSQAVGGFLPVPFRPTKGGAGRVSEGGFEAETATMDFHEGGGFEEHFMRLRNLSGHQVAFHQSVVDLDKG